jgi:ribonuclease P protein component
LPATPKPDRARQRFLKTSRLRQSRDFSLVRTHGRSVQGRHMRIGILLTPNPASAKVGFITSRRIGGAVIRTRARRRLREILRPFLRILPSGLLLVVVAKSGAATAPMAELQAEWLLLARRVSIVPAAE